MTLQIIKNSNGFFQLQDDEHSTLKSKAAQRILNRFEGFFQDRNNLIIKPKFNYRGLEELIRKLNSSLKRKHLPEVRLSNEYNNYIHEVKYNTKEQMTAGLTIKNDDPRWNINYDNFKKIVASEIARSLKPRQEKVSFFLSVMKRAANFSVPGSGKTAMTYGAFAYLSSRTISKVDKILVICPLSAFEAWKDEFTATFGSKRQLHYLNLRDNKYNSNEGLLIRNWVKANIIVINYEALPNKISILNRLINKNTMLVFDEVHRIKRIGGKRATAALNLSKAAQYRYVLTGTPIPNGYKDVYNFLHILYPDEYNTFFGWDLNQLDGIDPRVINQKLAATFWRITKKELEVPEAEPDIIKEITPSLEQKKLAHAIRSKEKNYLACCTRLLQASTNPELLKYNINYSDLGIVDGDTSHWNSALEKVNSSDPGFYKRFNLSKMASPKFDAGINLIKDLVSDNKKVLVWAIFVGTMKKIRKRLNSQGIETVLVCGETPKDQRHTQINKFKHGTAQVLVTNPNTLGEAISLHKTAHDAVYFEYNFNLTFMLQSRDRIHRLGLSEHQHTRYYYLMSTKDKDRKGFIDEAIYRRLKKKERVMINAIEGPLLVPEITDDYLDEVKKIILD